jgi:predicted NBD/HSP70 family sugar kinase
MDAMKTVALDVHTEWCQMAVISPEGEVLIELQVPTKPEDLRHRRAGRHHRRCRP